MVKVVTLLLVFAAIFLGLGLGLGIAGSVWAPAAFLISVIASIAGVIYIEVK